jgi:hypothetical protein
MKSFKPERRMNGSRACDLKVSVFIPENGADEPLGRGTLIGAGLGGGLLAFPGPLRRGERYALKLTKPAAAVLPCRVWREAGASGENPALRYFGLVFDLSPKQEDMLAVMLDTLADE